MLLIICGHIIMIHGYDTVGDSSWYIKQIFIPFYAVDVNIIILSEKEIEHILYDMYVGKKGISSEVGVVYDTLKWKAEFCYTTLLFEGRNLCVIDCYHEMLTLTYGDYMQLPPEKERYRNHFEDGILKID